MRKGKTGRHEKEKVKKIETKTELPNVWNIDRLKSIIRRLRIKNT